MARGPCTFKKTDLTRAVEAVVAAGLAVNRVLMNKDGSFVLMTDKDADAVDEIEQHSISVIPNPWDRVLRRTNEAA
jgi:hypothetical protein